MEAIPWTALSLSLPLTRDVPFPSVVHQSPSEWLSGSVHIPPPKGAISWAYDPWLCAVSGLPQCTPTFDLQRRKNVTQVLWPAEGNTKPRSRLCSSQVEESPLPMVSCNVTASELNSTVSEDEYPVHSMEPSQHNTQRQRLLAGDCALALFCSAVGAERVLREALVADQQSGVQFESDTMISTVHMGWASWRQSHSSSRLQHAMRTNSFRQVNP